MLILAAHAGGAKRRRPLDRDGEPPASRPTRQGMQAPGPGIPAPGVIWKGEHDRTRRIAGVRTRAGDQCRAMVARARRVDLETRRHQRGLVMFAALYAPSLPAAALVDVARAFTPRFEQIGSVILLDASGLSRLFGSAQELGEHLRDALSKHLAWRFASSCCDCVDANGRDAARARQPGPHGGDAGQGSDRARAAQRRRAGSIRAAFRIHAIQLQAPKHPSTQAHPIQAGGITRDRRIRRAEERGELPRIACWRF